VSRALLRTLLRTRMHDFAGRRPVQQFDIRAGDAVERHVHQPWCSARDCPCAAADPASAACAAVIWAAATCARRHLPACDGLVLGSIRSYRRSRYLLTRPVSRIVLSPLLQLVSSRRFAGLLQRSPGPVRVCAAALAARRAASTSRTVPRCGDRRRFAPSSNLRSTSGPYPCGIQLVRVAALRRVPSFGSLHEMDLARRVGVALVHSATSASRRRS
jgi:hypothetical protein